MSNEPITCSYVFTAAEYKKALSAFYLHTPVKWWLIGFAVFLSSLAAWQFIFPSTSDAIPTTPLDYFLQTGLPILIIVFLIIAVPFWTIRTFRKSPIFNKQLTYTFSQEGILLENPLSRSETKWEAIIRFRETKIGFLYFFHKNAFNWLPKNGFNSPELIRQFRALVRQNVKKCHLLDD